MTLSQFSLWLAKAESEDRSGYRYRLFVLRQARGDMEVIIAINSAPIDTPRIYIENRVSREATLGEYKLVMVEAALRGLL